MSKPSTSKKLVDFTMFVEVQMVKTVLVPKEPKKVDIESIRAEGLDSVHKYDPFLYYSIPGVRSAMVLRNEIDASHLDLLVLGHGSPTDPSSPQSLQERAEVVTRSSRISFECHPGLMFQDLWNGDADMEALFSDVEDDEL